MSVFIRHIGMWDFSFLLVVSLSSFTSREIGALKNELGGIPSSLIFWKHLRKTDVSSSLNVLNNSLVKPSGARFFFVESL